MTLEYLQEHWQEYAIEIDVYFPKENRHIKDCMVLKERFFVCFISKEDDALIFDPGGNNPAVVIFRLKGEDECHLKFPGGTWGKIGRFVRLKE